MKKYLPWSGLNYPKLTTLERFRLSAEALKRDDYNDFQRLQMAHPTAMAKGHDETFDMYWKRAFLVSSVAFPQWVENETALRTVSQAIHFVEMTNEQSSDLAGDYYCQGYKAAWSDAGRSDDELNKASHPIGDCGESDNPCDVPAESGIYAFRGLEKQDAFIYKPAIDELHDQFTSHLISVKALYTALERLCDTYGFTLSDLLAINPAFQLSIKRSREFLSCEVDDEIQAAVIRLADVYYATLKAAWTGDTRYQMSAKIGAVYGPDAAAAFTELSESKDLAGWDEVKLFTQHMTLLEERHGGE